MKHTFKVGDKVRVLASSRLNPDLHNKKAVVVEVEPEDYTGVLPVAVQIKGVEPEIWLRLDDLAPREKKPLKVGDRVVTKVVLGDNQAGTEGVVCRIDPEDADLPYQVEFPDGDWWCSRDQLKRVRASAEAATEAPTKVTEAPAWPWPAGTRVRLLPEAHGYDAEKPREVYTLWHDGTDCPPVMKGNEILCFVPEGCVERVE